MSRNHSHDLLFKAKKKSPAFPWSGKNEEAPRSAWPKLIVDPGSLVPCAGVGLYDTNPNFMHYYKGKSLKITLRFALFYLKKKGNLTTPVQNIEK